MKKRILSAILACTMAATLSAAPVFADDVIKIGLFEPLTGENGGGGTQEWECYFYENEDNEVLYLLDPNDIVSIKYNGTELL